MMMGAATSAGVGPKYSAQRNQDRARIKYNPVVQANRVDEQQDADDAVGQADEDLLYMRFLQGQGVDVV